MNGAAIISKRYAIAFLNLYIEKITQADFDNMRAARDFLNKHRRALFFLTLPHISQKIKLKALKDTVIDKFDLPDVFEKLCILLLEEKRIFLLSEVFKYLVDVYKEKKGIMSFTFTSAHDLNESNLDMMKQFLAYKTGLAIIYNYRLDKSLIAGIRLQSTTYLWEYSIKAQLNKIKLMRI